MSNLGNSRGNAVSSTREYTQTRGLGNQGNAMSSARTSSPLARFDNTPAYKFYVEIHGILEGTFLECTGLNFARDTSVQVKEGGVNNYIHYLPGRITQGLITLKRGRTFSSKLWDWFAEGMYDAKVKYVNISIINYDEDGTVSRQWDLEKAYPVKWVGPDFKADSNQISIETLEIAFHGVAVKSRVS